jgi:hypothetical protein
VIPAPKGRRFVPPFHRRYLGEKQYAQYDEVHAGEYCFEVSMLLILR